MEIKRKLLSEYVIEPLELMMEDVEFKGYNFIEVRHPEQGNTTRKIIGLDEAKVQTVRVPGSPVPIVSNIKIVKDGVVHFYPDQRFHRYGYVLDTKRNREWLSECLGDDTYKATDRDIQKQIEKLAKERGLPTVPVRSIGSKDIGYGRKDTEKEEEILNERIKELEEQLAEAKKPLAGKKINKK